MVILFDLQNKPIEIFKVYCQMPKVFTRTLLDFVQMKKKVINERFDLNVLNLTYYYLQQNLKN